MVEKNLNNIENYYFKIKSAATLVVITIFLCALPFTSIGAEFSAQVSSREIPTNQNFSLKLKLSDASTKSAPDFSNISGMFDIISTGQYSNMIIINGKSSSSKEWKLVLKPKKEGDFLIPSITIETDSGTLSTKPISIKITKSKPLPDFDKDSGIKVEAKASNTKPYMLEPFFYTIKLYTKYAAHNVIFAPIEIERASIKPHGSYKTYTIKHNNEHINVIELNYIITPLRDGILNIPNTKITGIYTKESSKGVVGIFDFIFEEEKPNMIVTNSKHFALEAKGMEIKILPSNPNVRPWLPAKSLILKETLDTKNVMVGKTITRTIEIVSEGLHGSQLPTISDQFASTENYTIYADSPKIHDEVQKHKITGSKTQTYNIIPQKDGKIQFPEIKIKWWDVNEAKIKEAILPAKTLEIKPNPHHNSNINTSKPDYYTPKKEDANLYWIVLASTIVLIGVMLTILALLRKIDNSKNSKDNNISKIKNKSEQIEIIKETLPKIKKTVFNTNNIENLKKCSSAKELNEFLKRYAKTNLNLPVNSSLRAIFSKINTDASEEFVQKLEGALYFNKEYKIEDLKLECLKILKLTKTQNKKSKKTNSVLPKLNPN